jgi:hypothetical protein
VIGFDHVAPWFVERITAWTSWFVDGCTPEPRLRLKMSISVPLGCTTIWWPIVHRFALRARMSRAGSHVAPPSVVREKKMSPRNA